MLVPGDARRLRILIGEDDTYEDRPLYEAILDAARAAQLAGVTVADFREGKIRSFRTYFDDLSLIEQIVGA